MKRFVIVVDALRFRIHPDHSVFLPFRKGTFSAI